MTSQVFSQDTASSKEDERDIVLKRKERENNRKPNSSIGCDKEGACESVHCKRFRSAKPFHNKCFMKYR